MKTTPADIRKAINDSSRRFWGERNAKLHAKRIIKEHKNIVDFNHSFCPIIKSDCRNDCECFWEGNAYATRCHSTSGKSWAVSLTAAYCSNCMLHGQE